jgi:hypothetical protein
LGKRHFVFKKAFSSTREMRRFDTQAADGDDWRKPFKKTKKILILGVY